MIATADGEIAMERALAGVLLASIAGVAVAVPTKPTTFSAVLPGTTLAKQPELAGTVVHDELVPFESLSAKPGGAPATGKVQVRVSRGKDGTLTFSWRIIMGTAPTAVQVYQLYAKGFPAAVYDANWRLDGVGTAAPASIIGTTNGPYLLTFDFATPLKPGESSRFMFVKTKATKMKPATGYVGSKDGPGVSFATMAPAN